MSDLSSAKTIQEGAMGINVPDEHQYKSDVASEVSYYQYRKLTPLNEPTLTNNGTSISEFEIVPSQVFNLSKSFLEADIVVPEPGAGATVLHTGFCPYIDQIEYLDASGRQLVFLQNLPYYSKITWPACTSQADFLSNPIPNPATTSANVAGMKTTLLNRSNVIPGLANEAIGGVVSTDVGVNLANGGLGLEAYTGIQHGIIGATRNGAGAGNLAIRLQMPLNLLYGTLFACNKDLYFGQTTTIRITWNQSVKFGYSCVRADGTALANIATVPTIQTNRIRLAIQANPISAESIKKKVISEGLHLNVPYTWTFRYVPTGAGANVPQSFIRKLNKNHGQRLLRVWTAQYNFNADSGAVAGGLYTNYCQNQNFANACFSEVWAQLDGVNLQESNLLNANGEVYEFMQPKLEGAVGGSNNQYLSSAYLLNDFTPWKTIDFSKADTEVGGLSLSEEREFAINFVSNNIGGGNTNLFYMFAVCQRLLSITREGVAFA